MIIVLAMMAALLKPPETTEPAAAFGKFMVNGINLLTSDISVVLTADDGVTLLTPG